MASVSSLTTNFTLVFGVAATLTSVVLGFLSAKQKVTLVAAEDSATTLRGLNGDQKLQIEAQKEKIILLEQKSIILEKHVTQGPAITDLAVQLGQQHKETMTAMAKMADSNNNVATEMSKIAKALLKEARNERS